MKPHKLPWKPTEIPWEHFLLRAVKMTMTHLAFPWHFPTLPLRLPETLLKPPGMSFKPSEVFWDPGMILHSRLNALRRPETSLKPLKPPGMPENFLETLWIRLMPLEMLLECLSNLPKSLAGLWNLLGLPFQSDETPGTPSDPTLLRVSPVPSAYRRFQRIPSEIPFGIPLEIYPGIPSEIPLVTLLKIS